MSEAFPECRRKGADAGISAGPSNLTNRRASGKILQRIVKAHLLAPCREPHLKFPLADPRQCPLRRRSQISIIAKRALFARVFKNVLAHTQQAGILRHRNAKVQRSAATNLVENKIAKSFPAIALIVVLGLLQQRPDQLSQQKIRRDDDTGIRQFRM